MAAGLPTLASGIRLLATDLDGTAMGASNRITEPVLDAVAALQSKGVRVMLATGRMGQSARLYGAQLGLLPGPAVCYNGAAVVDLPSGGYWFRDALPDEPARRIVQLALQLGLLIQVYIGDELWVSREDARVRQYVESNHLPAWVRSGEDLWSWPSPPIKLLIQDEPPALAGFRAVIEPDAAQQGYRVVNSQIDYLEVLPIHSGKGRALARVAERLGIPQLAVAACGDGENDVDMLSWAGLGIAMGQGHPAAKKAARVIAPSVDDDGLAVAIHRYILGEG